MKSESPSSHPLFTFDSPVNLPACPPMFTIKRLLLLLVLAVLVYCFWPRKPSLATFSPTTMAELQLSAAKQAASKNWVACGVTNFRIFESQYHFPPVAAIKAAIDQTRAVAVFRSSADAADKEAAAAPLTETYSAIKSQTGATFDPKAAASQQIQVWSLLEANSSEEAARVLASQLALVHGGDAKKYLVPATNFVAAATSAKSAAWPAAQTSLQKAWTGIQSAAR